MSSLFKLLGLLICGLVVVQLVVFLARAITHFVANRELRRLRIQQKRDEILALRADRERQSRRVDGWEGLRKFRVADKRQECVGCHSFYLVPHDGKQLPNFQPGQYLTFSSNIPGRQKKTVRCYSLSDRFHEDYYRVTIKKALPPPNSVGASPGVSSSFFNDVVQIGDILDVKAARGNFVLDKEAHLPVVLLAGGIGVTPLMSMTRTLLAEGSPRRIYLFAGFSSSQQHVFKAELEQLAAEHDTLTLLVCYSNPAAHDEQAVDYHIGGRIDMALLRAQLPSSNADYYLCGPGPFMAALTDGLARWGVPDERIHSEAFGPSSVKKKRQPAQVAAPVAAGVVVEGAGPSDSAAQSTSPRVGFARSQRQCTWDGTYDSLLELAEAQGIEIESGCRAGNCGTCVTAIKAGRVKYADEAGADCEEGTCLPCICTPDGQLVLDA